MELNIGAVEEVKAGLVKTALYVKLGISIIECAHIAQCRRKIESTDSSVRRTEAGRSSCREGQS